MVNSEERKKICVTGASGFIASWIVKLLLDRGYVVNGTVLSLNDPKEVHHLLTLDGANERLHLFEANLMKEGSFDSAIHGCDGVFHTACPVKLDVSNPQAEMIDPAVKGTLNVLASCAKVPSIKRVVFTSSMASVLCTGRPLTAETVVDDTWFSVPELCEKSPMKWYLLSKTFAEQAAWKFVKEHDIDMVSINPGIVIGPALQPTINASVAAILNLVNGSETYDNGTYGWVHVKDVAEAHILAFETPAASGRYLLNENVHHVSELVKILRELYPDLKVPNKPSNDKPFNPAYKVSKEKVESLGINYIPLEVGLKEAVESLIEKKFISA
ncbi:tetraketide alpha-pyrone reductase 1-like [Chenopodium quinoa]|uniref:NAD-dependent epimerase/dehydratase domain-containing protein n=1 Tax=Chenopodium quinoa TaxID=63459 RepID=A0A803MWL6_CHEQI|nr:tetraketide alpha-pyrone reductase 1-like [Chenopodium quinoa]